MNSKMYYGIFKEAEPQRIGTAGTMEMWLQRQNRGISSRYKEQGYPFDTPMWNGGVGKVILASTVCHDKSVETPLQESWWPYEQSAYLLDGLVRLGILLSDEEKLELFRKNLQYLLEHPDEKGVLGYCYNDSPSQWPMAVFFRGAYIYYRYTGDRKILDALYRHFSAISVETLSEGFRHINNLEGLLKIYEETKDESLLEKAVKAYVHHNERNSVRTDDEFELHWNRLSSGKNFVIHGVSFSESVKIPVMLYLYTGDKKYLDGAEKGLAKVLELHEQIPGLPSSNEDFAGKDPLQGYETCLLTDFVWALGYFLQATGKAEYADRMEKIIYNALPGSVWEDFSSMQYMSSPNQVIASEISHHSFFFRGMANFRQYRPDHSAQCCPGNVHRALPSFVLRSWLKKEDDSPVAALYMPGTFRGEYEGSSYTIKEDTLYPEEETVTFTFVMEEGKTLSMPFTFRIPAWSRGTEVWYNGVKTEEDFRSGSFHTLNREWKNGDTLKISFTAVPEQKKDRYWSHFERGVLIYSLPVAFTDRKTGEGMIVPREVFPAGKWNYGISSGTEGYSGKDENGLYLEVEAFPVSGFDYLEQGRYTPQIPLFCERTGEAEKIKLRPYGKNPLRITAFPDAVKRKVLPVYQVLTSCTYPYDFRKDLSEQKFLPEYLSENENLSMAEEMQPDASSYYSLLAHFGQKKDVLAYMYFRFWNDENDPEEEAVLAVSASDGAEIFVNGEKVGMIEPPSDGEFMAPEFFRTPLKKGYNLLMLKVCEGMTPFQYRKAWGARVNVFAEK